MKELRAPKMILFDYGQTLVGETEYDLLRGNEALMRCAVKNLRNLTPAQAHAFTEALWDRVCGAARQADREIHEHQFVHLAYELLQIEFSIPVEEQSRVFYDHTYSVAPLRHIEELLEYLAGQGIRTGVVSNISEAGDALAARIAQHLPDNAFEFVIASSEYGVRKPDPLIFQLALAKADLPPEDVWFCGDNHRCDVEGAFAAGMQPIWYCDTLEEPPACPHLHIRDWREFIEILKDVPCTTLT